MKPRAGARPRSTSVSSSFFLRITFEGIEGEIPEPSDFLEFHDDLLDRIAAPRCEFVDSLASALPRLDQSGPHQQASVLADGGAADREAFGESARPAWAVGEPVQKPAAGGIGQGGHGLIESRHGRYVTRWLRICQELGDRACAQNLILNETHRGFHTSLGRG